LRPVFRVDFYPGIPDYYNFFDDVVFNNDIDGSPWWSPIAID
jgi:hypothetical protein